MTNFHVGQKVVCIRDDFSPLWFVPWKISGTRPVLPRAGVIYTIRGVCQWQFADTSALALYLEEIRNPPSRFREGILEHPFSARRFRPVIERKTDISVFTKILDDVHSREPVE